MKFTSLIFTLFALALASRAIPVSPETEQRDVVKGGESLHVFPCVDNPRRQFSHSRCESG